jgi:hypothetical protein
MTHTRSPIRFALTAVAFALAAPAAQAGVIATGSGRAGATVAALVALVGVVVGGLAVARPAAARGRDGAIVALVVGLMGTLLAALHLATSTGAVGTGNGRGGAIVALVMGLTAVALGRLALSRSRRAG